MEQITLIAGIACLWVAFYHATELPKWIAFKPFSCAICMAFWTTLIIGITTYGLLSGICYAGFSSFLVILLNHLITYTSRKSFRA